jgi:hypothetical protein
MQAIEKLEEATLMKLLRKHKMLAVQYKGVAGQQRCGQHAFSIRAAAHMVEVFVCSLASCSGA